MIWDPCRICKFAYIQGNEQSVIFMLVSFNGKGQTVILKIQKKYNKQKLETDSAVIEGCF